MNQLLTWLPIDVNWNHPYIDATTSTDHESAPSPVDIATSAVNASDAQRATILESIAINEPLTLEKLAEAVQWPLATLGPIVASLKKADRIKLWVDHTETGDDRRLIGTVRHPGRPEPKGPKCSAINDKRPRFDARTVLAIIRRERAVTIERLATLLDIEHDDRYDLRILVGKLESQGHVTVSASRPKVVRAI